MNGSIHVNTAGNILCKKGVVSTEVHGKIQGQCLEF
jgi:hypothetical protein